MSGKYGQLMGGSATGATTQTNISNNNNLAAHGEGAGGGGDAAAGRNRMLSKKMHETRRFDSGDYFRGLIPEELAVGGGSGAAALTPAAQPGGSGVSGQVGQTPGVSSSEQSPQHLGNAPSRLRFDASATNDGSNNDDNSSNTTADVAGTSNGIGGKPRTMVQQLLLRRRKSQQQTDLLKQVQHQNMAAQQQQPSSAAKSSNSLLRRATERQVMLRRGLQAPATVTATATVTNTGGEAGGGGGAYGALGGQTAGAASASGQQVLLARKLREVKRFDSGDYFRGIMQGDFALPDDGEAAPIDNSNSLTSSTLETHPTSAADAYAAAALAEDGPEVDSGNNILQQSLPMSPQLQFERQTSGPDEAELGRRFLAHRLVNDPSKNKRFDSADYSMANLTANLKKGGDKGGLIAQAAAARQMAATARVAADAAAGPPSPVSVGPGSPGSVASTPSPSRNARRMEKYGKLSARAQGATP